MKWIKDGLVLESGRTVYANHAIIGLTNEHGLAVFGGYDQGVDESGWTRAERADLALEMMRLWAAFGGIGLRLVGAVAEADRT